MAITYKDAGVDISKANEAKARIKALAKLTFTKNVISEIGLFGGLFQFDKEKYTEPVLVASTDGVGTKLKLAYWSNKHNTVGIDLVNHCVNDILVQGARPLFFLDYMGLGKMKPDVVEQIIKGFTTACKENNCALIGGETAELPGLYKENEYDLAGFIVGVVEKNQVIDGRTIKESDKVIGLKSSGLHTNGYSLALKLFFEVSKHKMNDKIAELGNQKLGEVLMAPHKSYLKILSPLIETKQIKGMAHITGGGLVENIPRILPKNLDVKIYKKSWDIPPIYKLMQKIGDVPEADMQKTFNLGIGMVLIVDKENVDSIMKKLKELDSEEPSLIGEVVKGSGKTVLI